jgi:hypothetical protein
MKGFLKFMKGHELAFGRPVGLLALAAASVRASVCYLH